MILASDKYTNKHRRSDRQQGLTKYNLIYQNNHKHNRNAKHYILRIQDSCMTKHNNSFIIYFSYVSSGKNFRLKSKLMPDSMMK
jgi:hypothetical protein